MILRCWSCKKVRIDGPWITDNSIQSAVLGMCPVCKDLLALSRHKGWEETGRELLKQRAKGFGPCQDGEDEFQGFREPRGD